MKKLLVILPLLLIYSLLLSQPMIKFDNLEHDFGRIKEEGGPYNTEFIFTNTGDEPFKLIKVTAG
ncbi:MAG: DUF1573 domain-containing protein [Candidatus Cloacimonetes bacterium]|nr:DUF1573 domain-containing protein [Candidatus Cloacimonadota bacterium]